MKTALAMSAIGLAALTAVMGSAVSREQTPSTPPTIERPGPEWQEIYGSDNKPLPDDLSGCETSKQTIPGPKGRPPIEILVVLCPNPTPAPLRATGRM